jgi:hypothetical protein
MLIKYRSIKEDADNEREVEINVGMMRSVVRAVKSLSINFKFIVYPGGTRVKSLTTPILCITVVDANSP